MNRREFLGVSAASLVAAPFGAAPDGAGARAMGQRPLPKSEFDYVDWSWAKWREITGERAPEVTSAQTGRAELIDLLPPKGGAEWPAARRALRDVIDAFVGVAPARVPLRPETVDESIVNGITHRVVRYDVGEGERIRARVLLPRAGGRRAAVLCPHQTTQAGGKEPVGLAGNPELHTAARLAERGYVTITYDALCFGERHDPASGHYGDAIPFYRRHPRWSLLGKMIADLSCAIDYLETLDVVDRERIGSIGHSHGGITTLWGMALDPRIAAGVSNCGYDTFRIDGNTFRWSHATALLPRLGFYVTSPHINMDRYRAMPDSEVVQVPFDQHMLLALIAPRPLLLSTSDDDFVFPNAGWSARRSLAQVAPVYRALDAGDHLDAYYFSGGHRFSAEASAHAYEWLDRRLAAGGKQGA